MCQWIGSALVQIIACHLFGTKPLSKPCNVRLLPIGPLGKKVSESLIKIQNFSSWECIWKYSLRTAANLSRGRWINEGHWWVMIFHSFVRMLSLHYNDVITSAIASQITSLTIIYSTVYSGAYQRKHQSSASLSFVRGIHRWPVNSPHKGTVTRKMFPFDDVIMIHALGSVMT